MNNILSSGSTVFDELLKGGLEKGKITTIYGISATGKTNLCMITALKIAQTKKVIYIDSEGNASKTRLIQLAGKNNSRLENILILKPTSFEEQISIFDRLKDIINDKIGIIIVDSISMLYRVELANHKLFKINQELGKQLSYLLEIARKKNIPCLISAQVYNDFETKGNVKIVGGEIIKYASKVIIKLSIDDKNNHIAFLEKHPYLPKRKIKFKINQKGFEKVKSNLLF
jgi:DNA repair protein RadB